VIVAVQRVVLERADDSQLTGERPRYRVLSCRGAETDVEVSVAGSTDPHFDGAVSEFAV